MNPTLGIVVPVSNAEATLRRQVQDLLEILPDVAAFFRIVIVNDSSTDTTEDIAHELATTYPQVQVVRHDPAGGGSAIQTGIAQANTDVVCVHDEARPLRASDLHAALDEAITGPGSRTIDSHLLQRLVDWARALEVTGRPLPGPTTSAWHPEPPRSIVRRAARPVA